MTENRPDLDAAVEERGINGRDIVVLRNGTENGYLSKGMDPEKDNAEQSAESVSLSASSKGKRESGEDADHRSNPPSLKSPMPQPPSFHRDITFADEVKSPDTDNTEAPRIPPQLSAEQHIAFLENQRNPKDKGTLRIPGPREFDRGDVPETLDQGDQLYDQPDKMEEVSAKDSYDHPVKRNITIDEPNHPRSRTRTNTLQNHNSQLGPSHQHPSIERTPSSAQMRHRSGTFMSNKSAQMERQPMPYLSWQPTIGRNSAFIDLTEEQREELGGIEYRALKTLALVLVCR